MQLKTIRDAQVEGKRVLLRVDYNVPLQDGAVVDDARIKATLPTLEYLREHHAAQVIIVAHVGRPQGRVVEELRIAPIAKRLRELFNWSDVEILENVRFNPGEERNDPAFAKELASHGDIFVNDAFADAHRAHASIVGVAKLLPSYAGLLMEREVEHLTPALNPPAGSLAIVGGAKLTKLSYIETLAERYSKVLVGGALANEYKPQKNNIELPEDGVPQIEKMSDIGPRTCEAWARDVAESPFVLWSGPLGWVEGGFTQGTDAIANAVALRSGSGQSLQDFHAVIGGGDTDAALKKFSFDESRVFISTGGGAMLDFLVDGALPGLDVLKN